MNIDILHKPHEEKHHGAFVVSGLSRRCIKAMEDITMKKQAKADFILIPFLCQQEITDVAVLDPVSAHVELIQRGNIFRVVIADIVIRAELTLNGLIGCQQIGNLNIQFFSTFVTYKVDLLLSGSPRFSRLSLCSPGAAAPGTQCSLK